MDYRYFCSGIIRLEHLINALLDCIMVKGSEITKKASLSARFPSTYNVFHDINFALCIIVMLQNIDWSVMCVCSICFFNAVSPTF